MRRRPWIQQPPSPPGLRLTGPPDALTFSIPGRTVAAGLWLQPPAGPDRHPGAPAGGAALRCLCAFARKARYGAVMKRYEVRGEHNATATTGSSGRLEPHEIPAAAAELRRLGHIQLVLVDHATGAVSPLDEGGSADKGPAASPWT